MTHIVLLGDSIFDNAPYVAGGPDVIQHLTHILPAGWQATLRAVDGSMTHDVASQLQNLPADASHLFLSIGGNNVLSQSNILTEPASSVSEALMSQLFNEVNEVEDMVSFSGSESI